MLKHYSHIRTQAKRNALEAIIPKSDPPTMAPNITGVPLTTSAESIVN
jgi:hypothetical protein